MIELQNIRVLHGDVRALDDVSASFVPGCVTALAGANGSGKSTLLAVIAGVQSHTGVVLGRGRRVGFVAQHSAVGQSLPITVRDTVAMGRWGDLGAWRPLTRADRAIVADSIRALGLGGLERRALHELSGGQRQRALVAQGLASRADVLLLDEPAVGVDDEARALIGAAIAREVARGVAVVHATHDADAIASADHVIRLVAGRVI